MHNAVLRRFLVLFTAVTDANMAASEKNAVEIAKAAKLDHVPGGDQYEKMISGML